MTMKNVKLLFVFISMIMCVFACGSDNDDTPKDNNSGIVGTWEDGSTSVTFGSDGSYNLVDTSVPNIPQYRKGTYSYNETQKLLVVNVVAVQGQNGAYQQTFIVQTLTATTLVLLYTDGDVEGYYTRK